MHFRADNVRDSVQIPGEMQLVANLQHHPSHRARDENHQHGNEDERCDRNSFGENQHHRSRFGALIRIRRKQAAPAGKNCDETGHAAGA